MAREYFTRADQNPTLTVLISAPDTLAGQTWRVTLPLAGLTLDGRAEQDAMISAVLAAQFGGAAAPDAACRLLANTRAADWSSDFDPRQTVLGAISFELTFGTGFAGMADVPLVFSVMPAPSDGPAISGITLPTIPTTASDITLKDVVGGVATSIGVACELVIADNAPGGSAGGVLSGTYPDPVFAVDMATQSELDAVALVKADDNVVVKLAGAQTIEGDKAFSSSPIVPTPTTGDNTAKAANTAFVAAAITALVNSSPAALDTLNELAAALGNDPNFATTVTNALAAKAAKSGLTANQIAYASDPNTLTSNSALTFDAITKILSIMGEAANLTKMPRVHFGFLGDPDPTIGFLNYSHGNIAISFDAYHNGTDWIASHPSCFAIYKVGAELKIGYKNSQTKGGILGSFELNNGVRLNDKGGISVGIPATARVHVGSGSTAPGTGPLKLTAGPLLTTPEPGLVEYDGTYFYGTNSTGVRKKIMTEI